MLSNEDVDTGFRQKLRQVYTEQGDLTDNIRRWVGDEFAVRLGVIAGKVRLKEKSLSWRYRLNVLESLIIENAGDSTYFLLFDELDADYASVAQADTKGSYFELISSLFKAVQDVRAKFSNIHSAKIRPIIFLRDDIYERIQDSDKNKWQDARVDLQWDASRLKDLMNYRINRAIDRGFFAGDDVMTSGIRNYQGAHVESHWDTIFASIDFTPPGRKKRVNIFQNLCANSLMRPRDFVAYLQYCASCAKPTEARISEQIVVEAEMSFSAYMRQEFVDEMYVEVPNIKQVIHAIMRQGKKSFLLAASSEDLRRLLRVDECGNVRSDSPLEMLFAFSLIGIKLPKKPRPLFRYLHPDASFDPSCEIAIHPGLHRTLRLSGIGW